MRVIWYLVVALVGLCDAVSDGTYPVTFKKTVIDGNCTVLDRSLKKVLNRKKRWFVFPKGGNVLLTMVVTKTIIGGMPRGLQESMEIENAYSLPPWVEGWKDITLVASDDTSVKSAIKPKQSVAVAQPKIDKDFNSYQWNNYSNNYNRRFHGKPLQNSRQRYSSRRYPSTLLKPPTFFKRNKQRRLHPWHYHREYRERRQMYEKFEGLEKILGFNIKSCIKRAICEVKNTLLPEGESFIQDVARIVFTIPIDHEFEDDYADSARDEQIICARKFSVTCPVSPIEYFVQNGPRARDPTN